MAKNTAITSRMMASFHHTSTLFIRANQRTPKKLTATKIAISSTETPVPAGVRTASLFSSSRWSQESQFVEYWTTASTSTGATAAAAIQVTQPIEKLVKEPNE